jgi:hypothetical protein
VGSVSTYTALFSGLDKSGATTGNYTDSSGVSHGYVRALNGVITTFDAGTGGGTFARSIDEAGTIVGTYLDANDVYHGFVRTPDGTITILNVVGAGSGEGLYEGTIIENVNLKGIITGYYIDASTLYHAFVRAPNGTITTFNVKGAGTGAYQGTVAYGLNNGGTITGWYTDDNGADHGYMRN